MPVWLFETPFSGVFEQFIHRHKDYARSFHIEAQIEVEFVIQKMNVAVAEHAEERACGLKVVSVNDAVFDGEFGVCLMGNAVSASGHDMIQNSRKRSENRYRKDVSIAHFNFPLSTHGPPIIAHTAELIRAA